MTHGLTNGWDSRSGRAPCEWNVNKSTARIAIDSSDNRSMDIELVYNVLKSLLTKRELVKGVGFRGHDQVYA